MTAHRYTASVSWSLGDDADFCKGRFSRRHNWRFDGGIEVVASSSPLVVPVPMSDAEAVDPEEALVAALSSCHMLCFLRIAGQHGFVVESYTDEAVGTMDKNHHGKIAVTQVVLNPKVKFSAGNMPDDAMHSHLHHEAHEACFIANSVTTEVVCRPEKV
jgi:organic hydroperoxide reductase OsmC/OhrA